MAEEKILVTPFFKTIAVQDMAASRAAGRPIFKDQEHVEVRIAGERNYSPCFPALSMWKRVDGIELTYAERWPDQYRRFKENSEQIAVGTPLKEVPFLTEAKRAELRALKIYTAEALAALEGRNLKTLGMEANKLKQQARAYLDNAAGSADTARMAEEIAVLRQQIEEMRAAGLPVVQAVSQDEDQSGDFEEWDDESLKNFIAERTGSRPRGNPNHETLVLAAKEAEAVAA